MGSEPSWLMGIHMRWNGFGRKRDSKGVSLEDGEDLEAS